MLTLADIKRFKAIADKHPSNVASKMIHELLGELQEARKTIFKLRSESIDRKGPFTDDSLMPFDGYKGEPLSLVPRDYLAWWIRQPENARRDAIEIDARFERFPAKAFAIQRLKLFDYIKGLNGEVNGAN